MTLTPERSKLGRLALGLSEGERAEIDAMMRKPEPEGLSNEQFRALVAGETAAQSEPYKVTLLREVMEIVGKRGLNYGTPEDNFARIARRWTVHFKNRYGPDMEVDELDVAILCADLKLARLENEPTHMDSWKDIAGYAACGGEIAQRRIDGTWVDAALEGRAPAVDV
ncbi:DUF6378 domain-containing protein [Methyloceanibacter caenitepidi]|uniref:DUF6378 domain-containing protein n=1 Tax=Methyloceanibacter caenitepidi TaxID=1384459 RepID=A0A0A8JZT2_9HYPH|nr:DUF6378 domain-containing protein [Methyloceanibacter caenitepidi]BAQ16080.1 hypothetical protein GL4_0617 [Methyloceanibacter caenitepidi]